MVAGDIPNMEANLAVLIDFENIAAGTEKEGLGRFDVDALMKRLKDKGRILVSRSYADWGRFARFKQGLLKANVNMYELTSHGAQDKNRADIAMVVDCLELAFTRDYIDTFVVVSGDSDFTPLVLKMRELNKRVIGCGTRSSTSRLLIQACDEFIFYDAIAKDGRRQRPESRRRAISNNNNQGLTRDEAFDLVAEAIAGIQRENPDPQLASVVKTSMRRKQPDFSETELGYSSFARFLEAAQRGGHVSITRDTKSGGYRVDSTEDDDDSPGAQRTRRPEPAAPTGPWTDPNLPTAAEALVDLLDVDGINPLAYETRMAILETFVAVVAERRDRKRRVNVQFAQEDVRRRMRKTHPDIPARAIRSVFTAVMRSNVLMHKDGNPIRTGAAPFVLDKDADRLNQAMLNVYLSGLRDRGADLTNVPLLAELLFGNNDRVRELEETIAWMDATDTALEGDTLDTEGDLDALLTFDGPTDLGEAMSDPGDEPEPAQEPKAKAKSKAKPKAKPVDDDDLDALLEPDPTDEEPAPAAEEPSAKAAPKGNAKAKAKDADDSADSDSEAASDDDGEPVDEAKDEEEAKPKRKRVRKRIRKKEDDAPTDE